jgi:hypothetical protein
VLNAYDYERQEWVTGERARDLLRSQINEEIDLLTRDETREKYARLLDLRDGEVASYVAALYRQLGDLDA